MIRDEVEYLPIEVCEKILSKLDSFLLPVVAEVCWVWYLACETLCKRLCSTIIPSDIYVEIRELLGTQPSYVEIWQYWRESHIDEGRIRPSSISSVNTSWEADSIRHPHERLHQVIRSNWAVFEDHIYVGDSDGRITCHDFRKSDTSVAIQDVLDGPVTEMEPWPSLRLLVVSGNNKIKILSLETFQIIPTDDILKCGANNHLSVFDRRLSFSEEGHDISIVSYNDDIGGVQFDPETKIIPTSVPLQWKLWINKLIVLETNGMISIYLIQRNGSDAKPVFQYPPNMLIIYKNPCYMYRDALFCSTSALAGLIVRTSYWMMIWNIEKTTGELRRALDQDKINPVDDIWCLVMRRNFILCGTEEGSLILSKVGDLADETVDEDVKDYLRQKQDNVHLCRGHSEINLKFPKYNSPIFHQQVSKQPILAVDIGFQPNQTILYFRTDMTNIHCMKLLTQTL